MCDKEDGNLKECLAQYNSIIKENEDIYRELARSLGLSECSFWILYTLRTKEGAPVQSDVCACLHEPKQTVNSALKKMEADGLITLAHGTDRRSKKISLTSQGTQLCEKTVDRVIGMEQMAFKGLPPQERELFLSLFRKLTGLLKEKMKT